MYMSENIFTKPISKYNYYAQIQQFVTLKLTIPTKELTF